jgi:hypothetical protein
MLFRTELATRDQPLLYLAVVRRKEHVVTDRHHVSLRLDAAERRREIVTGVAADVASLPLPRHRQKIVRIHRREVSGHKGIDEGLHRAEAERLVSALAEELGTPPHHRPQLGVAMKAGSDIGGRAVLAAVEPWIGCDRFGKCLGEHEIVLGVLGCW